MPEPNSKPFWNTLPAYLAGIAAMITAIVGLARFLGERDRATAAETVARSVAILPDEPAPRPQEAAAVDLAAVEPARPGSNSATVESCNKVLGRWQWSVGPVGGAVDFGPNGAAAWYAHPGDPAPALIATWSCAQAGQYLVNWPNGYEDRLVLSRDGNTLSGSNQIGVIITGSRR